MERLVYRKIIVTSDGSDLANSALPHAVMLARASGAELLVTQVVDSVSQIISHTTPATIEPIPSGRITAEIAQDAVASQRAAAEEHLDGVAAELRAEGVEEVSSLVLEGSPGTAICDAVEELGVDLVVIATHGRSGLGRAVLGSVADHVVRHTPKAAVLVVRPA